MDGDVINHQKVLSKWILNKIERRSGEHSTTEVECRADFIKTLVLKGQDAN